MKSAKLAVLALLAASLTAGGLPAQGLNELPQSAATDAPGPGARSTVPSPVPAEEPEADPATPAQGTQKPKQNAPTETEPAAEPVPTATVPATDPAVPAPDSETKSTDDEDQPQDGEGYDPVVGGGFPVPGPNTPLVTDPDGTVRSAVETDISAAHGHGLSAVSARQGGAASTTAAAARSGTIQVTLVFATLTDNRGGVDQQAAKNSITEANRYWRAASDQRLGMAIAETKTLNSTANSGQDYAAMMNTIRKDLRWYDTPNEALVVFVPAGDLRSGGYGGILGGGWTSGPTSGSVLMPRPSGFTNNVVTHELGHVLGLLHANSLKCNNGRSDIGVNSAGNWADGACTSREYGDTSDLMGYAQYNLPMISSYFWDSGTFGRGDEILNAGAPGQAKTYTLRPWAGSAAKRAVKFKDASGETYYLELRTPVGYDTGTAVGGNRGVKIVKADLANSWAVNSVIVSPNTRDFAGYTNANSTWQSGQTFTTHSGTTVRINSVNGDSASVTITGGAAARAAEPIEQARAANPALGSPTSEVTGGIRDNGAYRNFEGGAVLWSAATGAQASVNGPIRDTYRNTGFETGLLGYPTGPEKAVTGGRYQDFQNGAILWSASTGAQVSIDGSIRDTYRNTGYERGPLGFPTSGPINVRGGQYQNFTNGAILWSAASGAQVSLKGAIRTAYQKAGFEAGALGFPTGSETSVPGGSYQNFTNGAILWSAATGAQVTLNGAIRETYQRSGYETGPLGFPTGSETSVPGGKYQNFAHGAILWSAATGAQVTLNGDIRDAYRETGFETGPLGFPTSGEVSVPGGKYQDYKNGAILWTASGGAQISLSGAIRDAYRKSGFERGPLGFPTGGETNIPGGKYQNFQNGAILWSASGGAQVSPSGAIRNAYAKTGYETGPLGFPTSGEVTVAGGKYQNFSQGAILWSDSTGAQVSVKGAVRDAYAKTGFETGPLGFPTSGEVSIPGGKHQTFANGTILWTASTGAQVSADGPIRDAYRKSGSETGPLGFPTSGEVTVRGGKYQDFQNGAILWSAATGAQVSPKGVIRDAYSKTGYETGVLGFPISAEITVAGGGKYQNFSKGSIHWTASAGALVSTDGPIRDAYRKSGSESGPLGFPTGSEKVIPGGKYQNYKNGAILWSAATGAQVSLTGPIRDAYQKTGFETGGLGFPTSGEVTIPGGKYQNYRNGAILWSSATGAQVSQNGPIRDAYRGQGFESGRLGFPTTGEYAVGKTKVQDFRGGKIVLGTDGKALIQYK
ncbi:zinc-dependent metalloprotease family protein [Arthrobacter sp. zg-Y769]|uniref:zinc-dependent metalloprotease family protein n=1 Tax=Arthrobacter sp. zg-Y769 TaxID=2894191 RepID=UPI001E52F363|nr:zinc-dependent metalloprotease family protein [Arthrobacter sp. zg-Y769]MCC9204488.1 hypothetical protein [Arthrobacter sp. zg-Y769]